MIIFFCRDAILVVPTGNEVIYILSGRVETLCMTDPPGLDSIDIAVKGPRGHGTQ